MIVSARVFSILLVPLLLHAAQTPPLENVNPHASRNPTEIGRPPGFANGMPPLPALPPPGHMFEWPARFPNGVLPPVQIGPTIIEFQDFTHAFLHHSISSRRGCVLPQGTYYHTAQKEEGTYFKPGFQIVANDAIAVTPKHYSQPYLILLPINSGVTISHDLIHVSESSGIRVVRISNPELMRIESICNSFYEHKKDMILAEHKRPQQKDRYMRQCYHINVMHVGYDFIWMEVREYDRIESQDLPGWHQHLDHRR